jgi:hypothetical protein
MSLPYIKKKTIDDAFTILAKTSEMPVRCYGSQLFSPLIFANFDSSLLSKFSSLRLPRRLIFTLYY